MPSENVTALLGEWEGYRVGLVQRHGPNEKGAVPHVWIELIRRADVPLICSGCGQVCDRYHDWDERWIRDLPILDAETHLLVQQFRVACPTCRNLQPSTSYSTSDFSTLLADSLAMLQLR